MQVAELREKLKDLPDDALIFLDDHAMPTPMGFVRVQFESANGFMRLDGPDGPSHKKVILSIVTLATYEIPEDGWKAVESFVSSGGNGQAGTRSKSKKKKSKRK